MSTFTIGVWNSPEIRLMQISNDFTTGINYVSEDRFYHTYHLNNAYSVS